MSNMDNRQWATSIEPNISIPADFGQVASDLCENALADAKASCILC